MPSPYRMLVRAFVEELERGGPSEADAPRMIGADAVAHVPGSSSLAGDYRGPDGFVTLFDRQRKAAAGGLDLELQSYDVQHAAAAAVVRISADRDGATYRDTVRFVMGLGNGKIKELWLDPVDPVAFDAFFR